MASEADIFTRRALPWEEPMDRRGPHQSARKLLALLDNPDFRREAVEVLDAFGKSWDALPSREEFDARILPFFEEHVRPLVRKWGVLPPTSRELVDPNPRLRAFDATIAGRFGLIPLFPWTTHQQIIAAERRIRRAIGRQHSDRENTRRVQLAVWLSDQDVPIPQIARQVWGRRHGLSRPSRAAAAQNVDDDAEHEEEARRMRRLMAGGLDYRAAEQRFLRRLRGSEPKASAAIRMAIRRYKKEREAIDAAVRAINTAARAPQQQEPLAAAVRMILEEGFFARDLQETLRWAGTLRDALLEAR